MVSAIIADDEPLLRAMLRTRLARLWPELEIRHEMPDGRDVDRVIDEHAPDLFFLDIHMPGVNGLEAARAIGNRAHVVFVTAYDEHAVEAFERGAIDYVLKPFNDERLQLTVERLKERMAQPPSGSLEALLQALDRHGQALVVEGLQHIVDRAALEGLDRVLVVRGDEHHVGAAADGARGLQAVHAGHVDVEEEEVRGVLVDHAVHVAAVGHLVADLELGPEAREPRAQHRAQQRLIVRDDCRNPHVYAGTSIEATTPRGTFSSRTRVAREP